MLPVRSLAPLALCLLQQTSGGPALKESDRPPLAWASVSIHISDPDRGGQDYSNEQANGLTERGMVLRDIISQGYNFSVMPFREDEISGLPDWARSTKYDIVARVIWRGPIIDSLVTSHLRCGRDAVV